MRKLLSLFVTFAMCCSLVPAPALAELVDELDVAMQEEMAGDSAAEGDEPAAAEPSAADEPAAPAADDVSAASADPIDEPAAPEPAADDDEDATLQTQDGDEGGESTTTQFHIQTAQVQGNNATTLASGPNYKHVPTTYYYQLGKDYPVPYRYDGWPLNYTNYFQSSGIYFPGDKIVILAATDSDPNDRTHGQPGICFQDGKGGYYDYDVGTKVGPLLVSGAVTVGNWHPHTYVTELTVVDGPVMFSTESGNSGASGWADSGPDENGFATAIWPVSSIRYIELPKYHPIEYHYRCGSQEIPAEEVAKATYYNNKPANPQVVWAEDLSTCWLPYVTYGTQWDSYQAGNVFTISRPYIEGYRYTGMEISMDNSLPGKYYAWKMTNANDEQSYTTRFRFNGDWDFNWTFTNQKEGNESDPIIININYTREGSQHSTVTVDANGGTINGQSEWMYNSRYWVDSNYGGSWYDFDPQDHMPTRDGYEFDGWYADAACTQIISPSAQNPKDLSGYTMYASNVRSYVANYGKRQFENNGANHLRIYAKWVPEGSKFIGDASISVPSATYTGAALTPAPTITDGNKTLVEGVDYRILYYENNVNATSSARMLIAGIGDYKGVTRQTFSIDPKPVTIGFDLEYTTTVYSGEYQKPSIKNFTCSDPDLAYNTTNFYTSYSNNRDASTDAKKAKATVSVRSGNYTGSAAKEFTITKRKVTPVVELGITKTTYTGEERYVPVTVKVDDNTLSSSYFTTEVTNNVEVGKATVTVTLKNNYEGTGIATFQIVAATKTFSVAVDSSYSGDACIYDEWYKQPGIIVKNGSTTLTQDKDYKVEYANNYYPGTATVTVAGIDAYAGYAGRTTFQIQKPDIGTGDYTGKVAARRYTGQAVEPKPSLYVSLAGMRWSTTLDEGDDYVVKSYANNVNVGTATMTIEGTGYFTGTATLSFAIEEREGEPTDISTDAVVEVSETYDYTGKPIRPYVGVKMPGVYYGYYSLTRGTDYDVTYTNNVEVGTATVTITGVNDYTGTKSATFQIVDPDANLVSVANATVTVPTVTYTGSALTPAPTVKLGDKTLVKGTDYKVTYANNIKAGKGTVTITGMGAGGYKGTKTATFTINRAKVTVPKAKTGLAYTGKAQAGVASGTGYALTGTAKATNAGTYKATATPDANHAWADGTTAKKTISWTIARKKVAVPAATKGLVYNGKAQVGVKSGTGYALSGTYKATNAGTHKATATPDANHAWADGTTAKKTVSWKIAAKAVTPTVKLAKTSYAYNGKVQKPAVTVKVGSTTLAASGYTVTYASGLKAVGAYRVTVTLKGNYSGSKSASFTIVPRATALSKLAPASKSLTATWAARAEQTSGYQLQYATNAKFSSAKTVTVAGPKATSKRIASLAGKKRYYVRIRTYRKVGTATYYSAWSAAKSAVTKA